MKHSYLLIVVFFFSVIFPISAFTQSKMITVITIARDTLHNCKISDIKNDTVELMLGDEFRNIPVDSLKLLILPGGSNFWTGAEYGTIMGGILGAFIGSIPDKKEEQSTCSIKLEWGGLSVIEGLCIGALVGCPIGGVLGLASGGDVEYDLSHINLQGKIKILNNFINKPRL